MFFRVSSRTHDGLLFMSKLASHWPSRASLTVEEAAKGVISAGYLEQIIAPLRKAGLVAGRRGPGGGYVLARPPGKISVREVVEALEGKIALVDCQSGVCPSEQRCGSRFVWNTLQRKIGETLGTVTLTDIAEKGRRK
ncbi:Rrf2 family transcriptional regulator [Patescibacteria group bacterium]|nr:MAG: Rrf2 family transcriptional regulator [Patescibacteria group bacterium]